MPNHANEECRAVQVARAFFQAATKLSEDNEDILPQVGNICDAHRLSLRWCTVFNLISVLCGLLWCSARWHADANVVAGGRR